MRALTETPSVLSAEFDLKECKKRGKEKKKNGFGNFTFRMIKSQIVI